MTDLIIQGINGRMGHTLVEKISARSDCRIVAGVDQKAGQIGDIPVYTSLEDLPEAKGIVIDFTSPAGTVHAAQFCAAHGMPCVLCSTGLSKEDEAVATKLFDGEFDIEIVEKHHHNKLDAPSGTALMIANAINEEAGGKYEYVYDRHAVRQKRGTQELGISSVRGGGIVGDHDVLFCGPEEVVTISHVAQSRGVFADGAVQAALFLDGCEPGYYTMTDMLKGKMQCL